MPAYPKERIAGGLCRNSPAEAIQTLPQGPKLKVHAATVCRRVFSPLERRESVWQARRLHGVDSAALTEEPSETRTLRRDGLRLRRGVLFGARHMANRVHKLVLLWLLIGPPVWAKRLPVPPVPPSSPSSVRVAAQTPHRGSHSSAKAVVFSRRPPTPPIPPADIQQVGLAPVSDRDARPPSDPNSAPHTKVSVTDFRLPKPDAADGFPYGSRFRSPQDARPIDTPGFAVTIPLRLP
jgi:hypothetical protein